MPKKSEQPAINENDIIPNTIPPELLNCDVTPLPQENIPVSAEAVPVPVDDPIEFVSGPLSDKIQAALDDTAKTGKAHELRLNKEEYFHENPAAAADPRMSIGQKDVLIINTQKHEMVTAEELYQMCKDNPNCKYAPVFRMAVMGLPKKQPVAIRLDQLRELREGHAKSTIIT